MSSAVLKDDMTNNKNFGHPFPELVLKHLKDNKTYFERHVPKSPDSQHLIHDTLHTTNSIKQLRYFVDNDKEHVVVLCETGHNICGHKGIVHGGFTATIIDNSLGALAVQNLTMPATKQLKVDYKRPLAAGGSIIVSSDIIFKDTRSVTLEAKVFCGDGEHVYAIGTAEFVDVSNKWKEIDGRTVYHQQHNNDNNIKTSGPCPPQPNQ